MAQLVLEMGANHYHALNCTVLYVLQRYNCSDAAISMSSHTQHCNSGIDVPICMHGKADTKPIQCPAAMDPHPHTQA